MEWTTSLNIVTISHMETAVKITELKARLSAYLRLVRAGGAIIVKDRDTPVARLVPYQQPKRLRIRPHTRSVREIDEMLKARTKDVDLPPRSTDEVLKETRKDYFDKWPASQSTSGENGGGTGTASIAIAENSVAAH